MNGPLDPASLSGEALKQWYLRSSSDIERERQALADNRYKTFFNAAPAHPLAAKRQATAVAEPRKLQSAAWRNAVKVPASRGPGSHDCLSCHGRSTPPPSPFPWPTWATPPALRDAPSTPRSDPPKGPPKQCEIQHQNDTEICGRQPNNVARAMCRESAMERYAYCTKTRGEVGHPRLFTHPSAPR